MKKFVIVFVSFIVSITGFGFEFNYDKEKTKLFEKQYDFENQSLFKNSNGHGEVTEYCYTELTLSAGNVVTLVYSTFADSVGDFAAYNFSSVEEQNVPIQLEDGFFKQVYLTVEKDGVYNFGVTLTDNKNTCRDSYLVIHGVDVVDVPEPASVIFMFVGLLFINKRNRK